MKHFTYFQLGRTPCSLGMAEVLLVAPGVGEGLSKPQKPAQPAAAQLQSVLADRLRRLSLFFWGSWAGYGAVVLSTLLEGVSLMAFPSETPFPLCPQPFAACLLNFLCLLPTRRWCWHWGAG